ncbi:MAG TPA: nicotinate-nucleotide adenylyltransferase [Candidatus Udaeobacter sp.]|nr:nicotinate-nucleotide adenylyltransferase [Candidatus Udaeobacter sp.]
MKKIAIYGGTFDPIHHGHLIVAREALEKLDAAEVIFIPARTSPLRKTAPVARDEIRLLMIQAAIENEPGFAVDDCELRRPSPSYTIDTIEQIRQRERDATIYCLIGEDNVDKLTKWRRFADLEKMVRFVVLDRSGQRPHHTYPLIRRKIDISATEIRKRVATGRSIRYFVPPAVEEIIRREKLYLEQRK